MTVIPFPPRTDNDDDDRWAIDMAKHAADLFGWLAGRKVEVPDALVILATVIKTMIARAAQGNDFHEQEGKKIIIRMIEGRET